MDNEEKYFASFTASAIARNNGYAARVEINSILAALPNDDKRLERFGFKVYSQGDEDGILEEIFRRLGIEKGVFCEIGVESGLECNSFFLLHKGWTGAWVEGNPHQEAAIQSVFGSILNKRLRVLISLVSAENVNDVLRQCGMDENGIDFLSIDIDGNDIYLLQELSFSPKVICIEYNAKFPGNVSKTPVYDANRSWGGTDYMGASLKAIAEVAKKKGYVLVGTNITGANAFFVRKDLAKTLFCKNSSPEYLYNPPRYWLIMDHFQQIGHRAGFGPYVDFE